MMGREVSSEPQRSTGKCVYAPGDPWRRSCQTNRHACGLGISRRRARLQVNRYLAETPRDGDLDALPALPLFMPLRAAIRRKVTAARLEAARPKEQQAMAKATQTYFRKVCELIALHDSQGTHRPTPKRCLGCRCQCGAATGGVRSRADGLDAHRRFRHT